MNMNMNMNIYLDQICVTASMVKEAGNKSEVRDTAVIGAMGTGTGLISNHVVNKLELNGKIENAPATSSTPLMSKIRSGMKSPVKSLGKVLSSKGFKNGAKIGAIGGAVGLAGDYAAVKINKALEKKAMNKFLEKVAEMYEVKGHSGIGHDMYRTSKIHLDRSQFHDYANRVEDHPVQRLPLAAMIGGGGLAAHIAHKRGGRPLVAGIIGASAGAVIGRHIANHYAHNKALEGMGITHPALLKD